MMNNESLISLQEGYDRNQKELQVFATKQKDYLRISNDLSQLFCSLKKRMLETALRAEFSLHINEVKSPSLSCSNSYIGFSSKIIATGDGPLALRIPRDKKGTYQPQLVKTRQTHITDIDSLILPLYAKGLTPCEMVNALEKMYGATVGPTMVSSVSKAVYQTVREWQNRTLNELYSIVYLDVVNINVYHRGKVVPKSMLLALGICVDRNVELMGIWQAEGTDEEFWLNVLTELRNRGLKDIFMTCVAGIEGVQTAINCVYPKTCLQLMN